MKISDKRILGSVNFIEVFLYINLMILYITIPFAIYGIVSDIQDDRLNDEIISFHNKIITGEKKENFLVEEVFSRITCEHLLKKQKEFWSKIEIGEKRIDTSKDEEIERSCSLIKDIKKIKFSEPILKI